VTVIGEAFEEALNRCRADAKLLIGHLGKSNEAAAAPAAATGQ